MTVRPRIRVSDHALVRFLERAGGFDIETLRGAIEASLSRAVMAAGKIGTNDVVVAADGLRYVVTNNTVVTILDAETMPFTDGPHCR